MMELDGRVLPESDVHLLDVLEAVDVKDCSKFRCPFLKRGDVPSNGGGVGRRNSEAVR